MITAITPFLSCVCWRDGWRQQGLSKRRWLRMASLFLSIADWYADRAYEYSWNKAHSRGIRVSYRLTIIWNYPPYYPFWCLAKLLSRKHLYFRMLHMKTVIVLSS